MLKPIITLKDIAVSFDGEQVLKNFNLTIGDGEFVTLLGPSGCGKTTVLRTIGGFVTPDSGDVFFGDEKINNVPPHKRAVNTIFQKYALFPHLNVYENIVLPIELDGGRIDTEHVDRIIETLGLTEKINNLPGQLSGGQQQRVAIARALATKPAILLADEPTGNLDSKTSLDVLGLLKVSGQKFSQTIVMITHNEEIAQMADRIIRIEDGRIAGEHDVSR